jgi:hypothetical protein
MKKFQVYIGEFVRRCVIAGNSFLRIPLVDNNGDGRSTAGLNDSVGVLAGDGDRVCA